MTNELARFLDQDLWVAAHADVRPPAGLGGGRGLKGGAAVLGPGAHPLGRGADAPTAHPERLEGADALPLAVEA